MHDGAVEWCAWCNEKQQRLRMFCGCCESLRKDDKSCMLWCVAKQVVLDYICGYGWVKALATKPIPPSERGPSFAKSNAGGKSARFAQRQTANLGLQGLRFAPLVSRFFDSLILFPEPVPGLNWRRLLLFSSGARSRELCGPLQVSSIPVRAALFWNQSIESSQRRIPQG